MFAINRTLSSGSLTSTSTTIYVMTFVGSRVHYPYFFIYLFIFIPTEDKAKGNKCIILFKIWGLYITFPLLLKAERLRLEFCMNKNASIFLLKAREFPKTCIYVFPLHLSISFDMLWLCPKTQDSSAPLLMTPMLTKNKKSMKKTSSSSADKDFSYCMSYLPHVPPALPFHQPVRNMWHTGTADWRTGCGSEAPPNWG